MIITKNIIKIFAFDTFICSTSGMDLRTYQQNKHGWTEEQWNEYLQVYKESINKLQLLDNKETLKSNAYELLSLGWRSLDELPDYYSFRCLIKFEQFGFGGEDFRYVGCGWWMHKEKKFQIDNHKEFGKFDVLAWMPLYDNGI